GAAGRGRARPRCPRRPTPPTPAPPPPAHPPPPAPGPPASPRPTPPRESSRPPLPTQIPPARARPARCPLEGGGDLDLDQDALGILDALLDAHQELNRLAPVDHAMIVRQRHVHHRPQGDGLTDGDRTP